MDEMIAVISIYANGFILVGMLYYAFACVFKPSVSKIWIFLAFSAFLLATTGLFLLFDNIWITLLSNIAAYIALSLLFSGSVSTKIIFAILIYISLILAEGLSVIFFNTVFYIQYGTGALIEDILAIARTGTTIIHLPLTLIIILSFRRYVNKKARNSNFNIPTQYTIIVGVMLLGVVLLSALFVASSIGETHNVFGRLTFALLLSATIIIAIIWLYNTILNNLEEFEKNKLKEQMLERWEVLYRTATRSQKTIATLKHNIQYDFLSIAGYLNESDIASAQMLITRRIGDLDSVITTGNIVIDTMLNYYQQKIYDNLNINLDVGLLIPANLNIDGGLTALILGNALENALEACAKVPKNQQYIKVAAELTAQSELFITVENPYLIEPVSDNEGNLLTIKEDKGNHGLGLSGIKEALSEESGQLHIEYGGGIFLFMFILYDAFQ